MGPTSPSAFTACWLKWPLSRWIGEQSGHHRFARTGDRFVAAFTCPPELRATFESLTGELVDERLAHYSRSRLSSSVAVGADTEALIASDRNAVRLWFRAKVGHSGGKPIRFVPPVGDDPGPPTGPTRFRHPDGSWCGFGS